MNRRKAPRVEVFTSFEEENRAEHRRLRNMTPKERWDELAVLQARVWGDKWLREPMKRVVSIEKVEW